MTDPDQIKVWLMDLDVLELEPTESGTTLTLSHTRLPTRSSAIDHAAGWHTHVEWMEAMLSAQRRRLPMVRVDSGHRFKGRGGESTLLELFDARRQLIVYHFMFQPDWDEGCPGCSWLVDTMTHPAHLHAGDTSIVLVSRAEPDKLHHYRERMGWDLPWFSSFGTEFNSDMGATVDGRDHHGISVFLRDEDAVFRTYYSGARGVEHLGSRWTYLDPTPFGRQETWEDSPDGWPQSEPYNWFRHDGYP